MEKRIKVKQEELRRVYRELKPQGMSLNNIEDKLGFSFKNKLYKDCSFKIEEFKRLQKLSQSEIEHREIEFINGSGHVNRSKLEKSPELAELVGLILGDGHLHEPKTENTGQYYVSLTFHTKENEIIQNSEYLLGKVLDCSTSSYRNQKFNSIQLRAHGKENIIQLKEKGLKTGNKVQKQVDIPNWILRDAKYQKAVLKGLIDTDGTIYQRKDGYNIVQFKNHSENLLKSFRQICENLDLHCSKGGNQSLQVARQEDVQELINLVKPIKSKKIENQK